MKTIKISLLLILLVFAGGSVEAQSKGKLKKQREYLATKKMVERGRFTFETNFLVTRNGERMRTIGEGLLIYDNKVQINFPFIGDSHRGSLKSDQNIEFTAPYVEAKIESNDKKRKILYKFQVTNNTESFDFSIVIYGNRGAKVKVVSSFRGRIEYEGSIKSNEQRL